ncbi:MAG: hypothetical protein IJ012_05580 [Clostridia bacterium]|nr:hypothetical protein [Clostridia bacterium]
MKNHMQTARYSLFLMVILTVINCVMLFTESTTYFLFSATFPYLTVLFGTVLGAFAENTLLLILSFVLAVAVLAAYTVLGILGNKHRVCFLIAAIMMVLDTVLLLFCSFGENALFTDGIFDILMHGWLLFDLFRAFFAKPVAEEEIPLPQEEIPTPPVEEPSTEQ